MTEFLFVRHCESEMNRRPDLVGGRSNHTPPTTRGIYQAALVGTYFREHMMTFDTIVSSGAVRTDSTARVIIETAGYDQELLTDPRLQEVSQGFFEGEPRKNVYLPEVIERYQLNELHGHLPGGESILDCQERMLAFLNDQHIENPDGKLLVVSHGLAVRAIVGKILGQSKQQILATETPNVSLTHIAVNDSVPTVTYVGKTVISE